MLGALRPDLIDVVLVFFCWRLFDSIGTLMASRPYRPGDRRTFPRARQALLGRRGRYRCGRRARHFEVTAYIESSTGVAAGGRTGLASVVTASLFLIALFMHPVVRMIGGGVTVAGNVTFYPIVAPALILVGVLMMEGVRHIRWDDPTDAIPCFLTMITMPLAVSITAGMAFGFVAYAILKPATGRAAA